MTNSHFLGLTTGYGVRALVEGRKRYVTMPDSIGNQQRHDVTNWQHRELLPILKRGVL